MKGKLLLTVLTLSVISFVTSFLVFKRIADSVIEKYPEDTVECQKIYTKAKQCIDAEFDQ